MSQHAVASAHKPACVCSCLLVAELALLKRRFRREQIMHAEARMELYVERATNRELSQLVMQKLPTRSALQTIAAARRIRSQQQHDAAVLHTKTSVGNKLRERMQDLRKKPEVKIRLRSGLGGTMRPTPDTHWQPREMPRDSRGDCVCAAQWWCGG